MKTFIINKPIRSNETVLNYKYPTYSTYTYNESNEKVDSVPIQVVRRWQYGKNSRYTYYRCQYQTYEILRVFHIKALNNSDICNTALWIDGNPQVRGYTRLAND